MIQEALQHVGEQAVLASTVRIQKIDGDHRKVFVQHGPNLSERVIPSPDRAHVVHSVADLIEAALRWNKAPIVWHDHASIVLVCDDADRFDRVTLPLAQADTFTAIQKLVTQHVFDQRMLLRLLKFDLAGCITAPLNLVATLREINFRQNTSGTDNIQHGKESLGRAIENEVTGAGDVPEQVTLATRVYSNLGEEERWPIVCAIDIDVAEQKFRLKPLPGEIDETIHRAQGSIRQRLSAAGVGVFFGKP